MFKNNPRTFLAPCFALALGACDAPASRPGIVIAPPPDLLFAGDTEVEFRDGGDHITQYLQKIDGAPITDVMFAQAVLVCSKVDPSTRWFLTLDYAVNTRVMGLGGSAYVGWPKFDCMTKYWASNGAIDL